MRNGGALPMQDIEGLLNGEFLGNALHSNIRPGSLDLVPTDEFYRVQGSFLPSCDETVFDALKRVGARRIDPSSILEQGACYVCRLTESVLKKLPTGVYAYANPKSSSGRVDVHVRMLVDKVSRYDSIPKRYVGHLWLLILPKTFSIVAPVGVSLNQIRFFNQDTRLDQLRLETAFEQNGGLLCHSNGELIRFKDVRHSDEDGSVILTLGLNFEVPGYEAVPTGAVIDLSKEKAYDPKEFFRRIVPADYLVLVSNTFYILSTGEYVRVPAKFACEMAPMDEKSGELRSHYAGFIDPGWGIGEDGHARGRPLTLEVRSFDTSIIIRNGQPIAKVRYERMVENPTRHYDEMQPNYGTQSGPQLSKHFKPWIE